jgi:hypothetical protein
MIRVAVIVLGVLLSFAANAQTVRMGEYLHPRGDRDETFNQLYLAGAKDALFVYNTLSPDKRYCLPQNLTLTTEQASDILRRWAKKQTSNIEEALLAQALLYALQETFPCPK